MEPIVLFFIMLVLIMIVILLLLLINLNAPKPNPSSNTSPAPTTQLKTLKRSFPYFFIKECHFNPRFNVNKDDVELLALSEKLKSLKESNDYEDILSICDRILKLDYTKDDVWLSKIIYMFSKYLKISDFDESSSRQIVDSCLGYLSSFNNSLDKSYHVRDFLVPLLTKNFSEIIEYYRENSLEFLNFEVYNLILNLLYLLPYEELLSLVTHYILKSGEIDYVLENENARQSIKNILSHINILSKKYEIPLETETSQHLAIKNSVLVNDPNFSTTWVGFNILFPPTINETTVNCKFYDSHKKEIFLAPNSYYQETFFKSNSNLSSISCHIVILGESNIEYVRFYLGEDINLAPSYMNSKTVNLKIAETNMDLQNIEEKSDILLYPSFSDIKDISISEFAFVILKNDGTVKAFNNDGQINTVNSWTHIARIYTTNFAIYGLQEDGAILITGKQEYEPADYQYIWNGIKEIIPSYHHILGIRENGTVVGAGADDVGQCAVSDWHDIVKISASFHSVGLDKYGNVFATGENNFGECNVESWSDIKEIATGPFYTLGLTSTGRVLSTGLNSCGQCNTSSWSDIAKIYARGNISVGIKTDGSVIITGKNSYKFENVQNWKNIREINMVNERIIGITNTDDVMYIGKPYWGKINEEWTNIKKVIANSSCVIALKNDNTLVSNTIFFGLYAPNSTDNIKQIVQDSETGKIAILSNDGFVNVYYRNNPDVYKWDCSRFINIEQIAISSTYLVGLKSDGTAVITCDDINLSFGVESWRHLKKLDIGRDFCIGLTDSGKVFSFGDNTFEQCDTAFLNDIVDIAISGTCVFALSRYGEVSMTGVDQFKRNEFIRLFSNISQIAVSDSQIMLLDEIGCLHLSYVPGKTPQQSPNWNNIKKIVAGNNYFACVTFEGLIFSTKDSDFTKWTNIEDIDISGSFVIAKKELPGGNLY